MIPPTFTEIALLITAVCGPLTVLLTHRAARKIDQNTELTQILDGKAAMAVAAASRTLATSGVILEKVNGTTAAMTEKIAGLEGRVEALLCLLGEERRKAAVLAATVAREGEH
jgi:hypothetical protein